MAANTRQDLAIYALELAKRQKKAVIKDLREVNRILKKVREKESKVVFTKIGEKEELCVMEVSDSSTLSKIGFNPLGLAPEIFLQILSFVTKMS